MSLTSNLVSLDDSVKGFRSSSLSLTKAADGIINLELQSPGPRVSSPRATIPRVQKSVAAGPMVSPLARVESAHPVNSPQSTNPLAGGVHISDPLIVVQPTVARSINTCGTRIMRGLPVEIDYSPSSCGCQPGGISLPQLAASLGVTVAQLLTNLSTPGELDQLAGNLGITTDELLGGVDGDARIVLSSLLSSSDGSLDLSSGQGSSSNALLKNLSTLTQDSTGLGSGSLLNVPASSVLQPLSSASSVLQPLSSASSVLQPLDAPATNLATSDSPAGAIDNVPVPTLEMKIRTILNSDGTVRSTIKATSNGVNDSNLSNQAQAAMKQLSDQVKTTLEALLRSYSTIQNGASAQVAGRGLLNNVIGGVGTVVSDLLGQGVSAPCPPGPPEPKPESVSAGQAAASALPTGVVAQTVPAAPSTSLFSKISNVATELATGIEGLAGNLSGKTAITGATSSVVPNASTGIFGTIVNDVETIINDIAPPIALLAEDAPGWISAVTQLASGLSSTSSAVPTASAPSRGVPPVSPPNSNYIKAGTLTNQVVQWPAGGLPATIVPLVPMGNTNDALFTYTNPQAITVQSTGTYILNVRSSLTPNTSANVVWGFNGVDMTPLTKQLTSGQTLEISASDPFTVTAGTTINFFVKVIANVPGSLTIGETRISLMYVGASVAPVSQTTQLFNDDFNSGLGNWQATPALTPSQLAVSLPPILLSGHPGVVNLPALTSLFLNRSLPGGGLVTAGITVTMEYLFKLATGATLNGVFGLFTPTLEEGVGFHAIDGEVEGLTVSPNSGNLNTVGQMVGSSGWLSFQFIAGQGSVSFIITNRDSKISANLGKLAFSSTAPLIPVLSLSNTNIYLDQVTLSYSR